MRYIVSLALTLVLATAAHASQFQVAKFLKNPKLFAISKAMDGFEGRWARSGAYTVTKKTPLNGRTEQKRRQDTCKETLHRYSGAMLDEGIDIRVNAAEAAVATLSDDNQDESYPYKKLQKALEGADKSLEIYAGTGGGNNTMASMIVVYDKENDQVVFLILSNFGSDD